MIAIKHSAHPLLRFLACMLALLMLGLLAVSCADNTETPKPVTEPGGSTEPEDETRILPDIPKTGDYGGQEFCFLYWTVTSWENTVRQCRDIYSEGITGDLVDNEVFRRNARVEEAYKIVINRELALHSDMDSKISQMNATSDNTYLVVVPRLLEQAKMVTNDYFQNLYDVPHMDLEKPWWDQDSISQLSSNNVLYLVSSSILVNDKDATAALAFNKDAATNHDLGNLYNLVTDNQWTYAQVAELAEQVNTDDGNSTMDENDFWGFLGKNDVMTSFFHGSGGIMVDKDSDDNFEFVFGSEDDINATQEIIEFMNGDFFYNHHKTGISDEEYTKLFESNHGLFFWMRLDEVTNMRNSEVDFGILPIPKYSEDQENFHSTVSQHTTGLISIPKSTAGPDLDMTGLILEALAADSHYDLQNAYIEASLKKRYSRDGESAEMLVIILGSRVFDPGCLYNFGAFSDGYQELGSKRGDIASFLSSTRSPVELAIEKYNEAISSRN